MHGSQGAFLLLLVVWFSPPPHAGPEDDCHKGKIVSESSRSTCTDGVQAGGAPVETDFNTLFLPKGDLKLILIQKP